MQICVHFHVYVSVHVYMCKCMCICASTCVCTCSSVYISAGVQVHMHINDCNISLHVLGEDVNVYVLYSCVCRVGLTSHAILGAIHLAS